MHCYFFYFFESISFHFSWLNCCNIFTTCFFAWYPKMHSLFCLLSQDTVPSKNICIWFCCSPERTPHFLAWLYKPSWNLTSSYLFTVSILEQSFFYLRTVFFLLPNTFLYSVFSWICWRFSLLSFCSCLFPFIVMEYLLLVYMLKF
jgi:hypothetical protein